MENDRRSSPSHFGKDVYLFPILSTTSLAQELATLKMKLGREITAMTVLPGKLLEATSNDSLLVSFQAGEK